MKRSLFPTNEDFEKNGSLTISKSPAPSKTTVPQSAVRKGAWRYYLVLGIVGLATNVALWAAVLFYLKVAQPKYASEMTLTLPGAGSDARVSLPTLGSASYENQSPYANSSIADPREVYKVIASSDIVVKSAAKKIGVPLEEFGTPRIKLVQNTTLMMFEFNGDTAEEAQKKNLAIYQALQGRLQQLRNQEISQRDVGFQDSLTASRKKLDAAQTQLSAYKARSGLSGNDQVTSLANNIEQLRKQRAEIISQQQQANARLQQLSNNLNLSSRQAADAFALQSDQLFQQYLQTYNEANSALVVLESKFLPANPTVVRERARRDAAKVALTQRSQAILGRPIAEDTLAQLNLSSTTSGGAREKLFQDLVVVQTDQQGFQAQAQEIDRQIKQLETRLKTLAQQEITLEALRRDVQVAEAVFTSTVTRLDIGSSNALGSYPLIQMLAEPSLPESPVSPKKKFALLGGGLGSIFLTTGLVTLGLYKHKNQMPKDQKSPLQSKPI
ncbi:hypothetical protein NDI37_05255 [Funiculus sociatus GB2-A5]|uniref:Lipopolysaccharide biosynthesis protein n=1 Tax=Funiculus sociatus GB2-A5 TaxID=2933946 RepID=A0ABV0JMF2_9CYAN|nr:MULTISPECIES: hypothetical protein [unclassified Trichocoleus]